MCNVVKTATVGNERLDIVLDENTCNPRDEYDHACTFFFYHRRYTLGDEKPYIFNHFDGSLEELEELIEKEYKPVVMKKVYMYDHSGITINTTGFSCPWDSGVIGIAFLSREKALENYGVKRITKSIKERAGKLLDGEIKEYDAYLSGDVYGFRLYKVDDNGNEIEEIDSCYGFYGDNVKENGIADYIRNKALIEAL